MVNVPIKTLLERLDQVSGDFVQLDNFIELKDSKILWSAEEDEILRKGGVEVDLLRKYRGPAVDARKKYLGINWFEFIFKTYIHLYFIIVLASL